MSNIKRLKLYQGCLIIVDMVEGFVTEGVLHDEKIRRIVPRQIELIKEAKEKNHIVIFIKDTHTIDSTEFIRFNNTHHCLKDTNESELIEELREYETKKDTISFQKNSTSFMESPLFREFIKEQELLKEFDVVGCCTDICVANGTIALANHLDEENRIHTIRVHEDAIATYDEEKRLEYVKAAKLLMKQQGIQVIKK